MNKVKAIIIDDEASSRNSLRQKLLSHCPEVEITCECENGEEGLKAIEKMQPDLIFLDVEMPRMNGFTLLQQVTNKNFDVIFTTAYDHYAIKAIRFSALDYLVKPIEVEELKDAVNKTLNKKRSLISNERIETLLHNLSGDILQHSRIAIPSFEGLLFVNLNEIIFLQAESNYTIFFLTEERKITVSKTMKEFEELLPLPVFIRVHHSHLINKNHIRKYIKGDGGYVIMSNNAKLDVARRKKEEFLKAIGH